MKPNVQAFLDEIIAVCKKHQLTILAEKYSDLEVWTLDVEDLDEYRAVVDKTED